MRCLGLYSLADVLFPNLKFIAESLALTCENGTQILSLPFTCFLRLLNQFGMSLHTLFCYYNFCQKLGGAPRGWGRKPQGAKVADHAWIFKLANLWHKTRWNVCVLVIDPHHVANGIGNFTGDRHQDNSRGARQFLVLSFSFSSLRPEHVNSTTREWSEPT